MRNVLFSLRTRALPLDDSGVPSTVGTNVFRATAERQMRLEFVRDHLLPSVFPRKPRVFTSLYQVEAAEKEAS